MTFKQYRQRWESEEREEDYEWEAEQNYLEWESLVTRQERLKGVSIWLT